MLSCKNSSSIKCWLYQMLHATKYYFSDLALHNDNPAAECFSSKKESCEPTINVFHTTLLWCSLKNAIMMQFHHISFIIFWTRPWVLKLRGMKGLPELHKCGSNILLKNRIITNSFSLFFVFDCEVSWDASINTLRAGLRYIRTWISA